MNTSLCLIRPENFIQEVVLTSKPVLILCMPFDEQFPSQLKIVETVATKMRGDLKVALLEEAFIETFKKKLQITGTPTFLFMTHGKEQSRMIGLADHQTLVDFIASCPGSARKTVLNPK